MYIENACRNNTHRKIHQPFLWHDCSGFEAGGSNTPSILDPWYKVGNDTQVALGTERSSPFDRNPIALKIQVLCDTNDPFNTCPAGGVGTANPGFWGMVSQLALPLIIYKS